MKKIPESSLCENFTHIAIVRLDFPDRGNGTESAALLSAGSGNTKS